MSYQPLVYCPLCEKKDAVAVEEEVDIGVGVQKHLIGYECKHCGIIELCSSCGLPDGKGHYPWCNTNEKIPNE